MQRGRILSLGTRPVVHREKERERLSVQESARGYSKTKSCDDEITLSIHGGSERVFFPRCVVDVSVRGRGLFAERDFVRPLRDELPL